MPRKKAAPGEESDMPPMRDSVGSDKAGVDLPRTAEGEAAGGDGKPGIHERVLPPVGEKRGRKTGGKNRAPVDVKAEGEEAVILLAAIHRFLTGEDPPEEQVAFNRRTVEGYARYYKIALSSYFLHVKAVVGGGWFLKTVVQGILKRFTRAQTASGGIGGGEDMADREDVT